MLLLRINMKLDFPNLQCKRIHISPSWRLFFARKALYMRHRATILLLKMVLQKEKIIISWMLLKSSCFNDRFLKSFEMKKFSQMHISLIECHHMSYKKKHQYLCYHVLMMYLLSLLECLNAFTLFMILNHIMKT